MSNFCCGIRSCFSSGNNEPILDNQQLSDDPPSASLRGCVSSTPVLCVTSCGTTAGATYTGWAIRDLWPLKFVAENIVKYTPPAIVAGLTLTLGALSGVGFFIKCADGRSQVLGEEKKLLEQDNNLNEQSSHNATGHGSILTISDPTPVIDRLPTSETQQQIANKLGYTGVVNLNRKSTTTI